MTTAKAAPRTWRDNADLVAGRGRSNRMGRTWKDNADEFGRAERGEGTWYQAALIACSVFTGKATDKINSAAAELGKVSTAEFAARARVSQDTVARYFGAWPKAIAAGAEVPPTSDLGPDDVGSFPIPARPFNGPGGYVQTRVGGPNSTDAVLTKIATGAVKLDAEQLTAAVNMASPTVIDALVSDMSDEAFEHFTAAVAAVTTQPETPAVITKTGVTPAKKTSPAKQKATEKLLKKVEAERARKWLEEQEEQARNTPRALPPKPDGWISPAQQALKELLAVDELWNTEVVIEWTRKTLTAVLNYPGPLSDDDKEFMAERLGIVTDTIAQIFTAIEAKDNSKVPDTVPDDWN